MSPQSGIFTERAIFASGKARPWRSINVRTWPNKLLVCPERGMFFFTRSISTAAPELGTSSASRCTCLWRTKTDDFDVLTLWETSLHRGGQVLEAKDPAADRSCFFRIRMDRKVRTPRLTVQCIVRRGTTGASLTICQHSIKLAKSEFSRQV